MMSNHEPRYDEQSDDVQVVNGTVFQLQDGRNARNRHIRTNAWDASVAYHPRNATNEAGMATRITAALNACDGIPTKELTPGMVKAWRDMFTEMTESVGAPPDQWAKPGYHWADWVVGWFDVQGQLIAMFGGNGGEEHPLGVAMTAYHKLEDQVAALQAENKRMRSLLENFSGAFMDGIEGDNLHSAMCSYGQAVDLELGEIKDENEEQHIGGPCSYCGSDHWRPNCMKMHKELKVKVMLRDVITRAHMAGQAIGYGHGNASWSDAHTYWEKVDAESEATDE